MRALRRAKGPHLGGLGRGSKSFVSHRGWGWGRGLSQQRLKTHRAARFCNGSWHHFQELRPPFETGCGSPDTIAGGRDRGGGQALHFLHLPPRIPPLSTPKSPPTPWNSATPTKIDHMDYPHRRALGRIWRTAGTGEVVREEASGENQDVSLTDPRAHHSVRFP